MSSPLLFTSWLPLLAVLPDNPAARAGYIAGMIVGMVMVLAVVVFGLISIVMAFAKRTTPWIVMGSISGFFVLVLGGFVIFGLVTGFMKGFTKGFTEARARVAQRSGPAETLTGKAVPFTIEKPAGWTVKRDQGSYDLVMSDRDVYVGVIAENIRTASTESLAKFARNRFQTVGSEATLSDNEPVTIDGHPWIAFTARAKVKDLPFAYQCYVYAGQEGAVQIMGWTFQSEWDEKSATLVSAMRTLHLPAPGGSSTKP